MFGQGSKIDSAYWAVSVAALLAAGGVLLGFTPVEQTMGPIQKVFYLHLPMAINTFLACLVVFISSIGFLLQRRMWWDDLALAAAKVSVLMCGGVLLTGMIWGRCAWGQWWTWSPRLTFSLMLWLLYVVYLLMRLWLPSPQRRAVVCAVYGVMAFLDVPLVWLSARMMPDIHPASVSLDWQMQLTLAIWFVPVTMITAGLIMTRFRLNQAVREEARQEFEIPLRRPAEVRMTGGVV